MATIGAVNKPQEHTASSTAVKISSKTLVKPSKKIGRKECQLVTFDLRYLSLHYIQKLAIYKSDADIADVARKLREALALVLQEFHQLAGRLGKDEERVYRIEYDDEMNGGGVEFTEAAGTDITVEGGSTRDFTDLIPLNGVLNVEGLHRPLLAVQLTKLKDGLAMGCAFNHAIVDGTSAWHFMSSWAEICNGSTSVSIPPFLDRTKARNTRVKLHRFQPDPFSNAAPAPLLREKLFKFPAAAISKIKSSVNSNLPSRKPFSTLQSLGVHIWRHVTQARDLKPDDYTVFTVFADCRKRVDPVMPDSYFGNLIQAIFTVLPAGMLSRNPPEFGAAAIQDAIEKHDAKAIDRRNEEWEAVPEITQFKDAGVNCVAVGSSPRFLVYEMDFGLGKPEMVRSGWNNRFDGMVYLNGGKEGGVEVEISLESGAMEKLEKDKEFVVEGELN